MASKRGSHQAPRPDDVVADDVVGDEELVEEEFVDDELVDDEFAAEPIDGEPYVEVESLLDPNEAPLTTPSEKELNGLIRDWRKGRATESIWDGLTESYAAVFGVVMIGAMVISMLVQAQQTSSACDSLACTSARALLPWALFAGVAAFGLLLARLFGPVVASAAEGFWILDAPIRRRRILAGRLIAIVVVTGLAGAVLGGIVATLVGSTGLAIGAWALATGLGTAAVVSFSAAEQGAERTVFVRVGQAVAGLAATAVMVAVVAIAAGWLTRGVTTDTSLLVAWVAAGASAVVLAASFALAWARLHLIRRARLQSGGSLVSGMQGAAFAMDFGLMRDILVEREMQAKGHVTPTIGRGTGTTAIIWRDVQRILRSPVPTVIILASAIVPYAVAALGLATVNVFVSGLVLCFLLIPLMGSLRVLSRTPGLLRMMPFSTGAIRTAAVAVPAVVALVWACLTFPGFAGVVHTGGAGTLPLSTGIVHAVLCAVAGLLGAMRWTVAKSANYATPTMATPMGAMPPTMVFSLFRGIDMVALVTLPLIFGLPAWVSIVLAVIIFIVLRGGMNPEELQAEQERQKRLAEQAKAERTQAPTKVKIKR